MTSLIRGRGGLFRPAAPPSQQSAPVDAPNTLRSKAIAEVLCVIGEGPIVEPDDLLAQVYLNGVPIKSDDGTLNFQNVAATISLGYPDQAYIPGTAAAETAVTVGTRVTAAFPVVRAVSDVTATSARVSIMIPALVSTDSSSGNRNPTSVAIAIDVQPDGGSYATVVSDTISGKCVSPAQFDYHVPLAGAGPWAVRVRRLAADSTTDTLLNETHWTSLSVLRDYRLAYPDTAMLRLRIDAEQFGGSFPTIEYAGDFLILEIPSNYDPIARTYSGIWDGTFTTGWTNNPAWVRWAALTNDRWGLGRWIDAAAVDKWSLYAAAQWFDELVSDGKGGLEPRYTFNGTFDSVAKAFDALTAMAGACQAMGYWASGSAHLVVDKPDDPVKQVGPANVASGKFVYQASDLATRPTAVHVTWRDPDNEYQRAVEAIEDPDKIALHGYRVKEVAALLCTSQGQAARIGRYELETAWAETQTANWAAGQDQHDLAPGDFVDVADPSIQGFRRAGRILATDGLSVTLDDAVTIESGQSYDLRVVGADGALQSRPVVSQPGETAVLSIGSAYSPAPIVGAIWQLLASNLAPRRFRILAIEERENDAGYAITAVQHDQNKQARIEEGIVLSLPAVSGYGSGPLAAPSGLRLDEAIERLPSGGHRHRVTVGWVKHPDPRVARYIVQHKRSTEDFYSDDGYAVGTTAELDELGSGAFEFRVSVESFDGAKSPWSAAISSTLIGLDAPPPNVENLTINVLNDTALLAWSPVNAPNLSHYEIRYSSDVSANWQSMVPTAPRVSSTSVQTAARSGLYGVKAVTAQGVESTAMTTVISKVAGQSINIVETIAGNPNWEGAFDRLVIDKGRTALRLAPDAEDFFDGADFFDEDDFFETFAVKPSGTFTWTDHLDLGEIFTSRVTAVLDVTGERLTDDVWDEPDVWTLSNAWGADPGGWDAWIEVSVTDDDPSGTPVWSNWQRLVASDVRFRAIRFRYRLITADATVSPIARGSIIVDMPDRIDAQGGLSVDAAGTRIAFTAAFRGPARPSVVITGIEGAAAGDWADVTHVDRAGFDIVIMNGSTPQSGRSIDYHAKGYGAAIAP